MKAWMRISSVFSADSAGSDPAWLSVLGDGRGNEVHDHGGRADRAGGLVTVHVQCHPAGSRAVRAPVPVSVRTGTAVSLPTKIARRGEHLRGKLEHRELHAQS